MNAKLHACCLSVAMVMLAGCATSMVAPIIKDVQTNDAAAKGIVAKARHGDGPVAGQKQPSVEYIKGIWLPTKKSSDLDAQAIAKSASQRHISINREFRSFNEVAERITFLTGLAVNVSSDVVAPPSAQMPYQPSQMPVQAMPAVRQVGGTVSGMPIAGALPMTIPNMASSSGAVPLTYDGPLSGFLDVASARFGVSWEWTGNSISIFKYITKTFRVVALPGDTTLNNTISNTTGGTGGATSGGATSTTGVSFSNLSVWTGIGDAIKGMLSSGGKSTIAASTGTVTVTDTPQIIARVEKFIQTQNESLGKQVAVNVRVLSVDLNDADQYGINWAAIATLSGKYSFGLANAFTIDPNAANLTVKVLKGAPNPQSIISALSTQGRVSQVTSASLTTLNNQPAPMQVGRQTSYLASSSTTIASGTGTTTTLQPGLITTGFSMSLVPHVLDKGRLMLQFAIDISSLLNLSQITSAGSTIQTPEVDTRNFLQRVMMNSGETLVLTGFEQNSLSSTMQGVGSASNIALGGGLNGKKVRSVLVILIQPVAGDM